MISGKLKFPIIILLVAVFCVLGAEVFYPLAKKQIAGAETKLDKQSEMLGIPAKKVALKDMQPELSTSIVIRPLKLMTLKDKQPGLDMSIIIRRNLFASKEVSGAKEAKVEPLTEIESTNLALVLMGTVIDIQGEHRAFIYDKRERNQGMYREGDNIQGALIKQISYGKVIIVQNGRNELLNITEAQKVKVSHAKKPVPVNTSKRVIGRQGRVASNPLAARPTPANSDTAAQIDILNDPLVHQGREARDLQEDVTLNP